MSVILVDVEDVTDTIEEEREAWIGNVLVALGANEERLQEPDARDYLTTLGLETWQNAANGCIDIYRNGKIVAQWKAPKLIKKKEGPNEYYYEIHINEWALPFQLRKK